MMLTQADIDAAVSESLAKTQELLSEYGEQFVRPLMEVQRVMGGRTPSPKPSPIGEGARSSAEDMQGGEDGQRTTGQANEYTDDAEASAGL